MYIKEKITKIKKITKERRFSGIQLPRGENWATIVLKIHWQMVFNQNPRIRNLGPIC